MDAVIILNVDIQETKIIIKKIIMSDLLMNKKENAVDILFKVLVVLVAIPIGIMKGLINAAKKF